MCIICINMAKGTLTGPEAQRALGEMRGKLGREHSAEVQAKINDASNGASAPAAAPGSAKPTP